MIAISAIIDALHQTAHRASYGADKYKQQDNKTVHSAPRRTCLMLLLHTTFAILPTGHMSRMVVLGQPTNQSKLNSQGPPKHDHFRFWS